MNGVLQICIFIFQIASYFKIIYWSVYSLISQNATVTVNYHTELYLSLLFCFIIFTKLSWQCLILFLCMSFRISSSGYMKTLCQFLIALHQIYIWIKGEMTNYNTKDVYTETLCFSIQSELLFIRTVLYFSLYKYRTLWLVLF